MYHGRKQKKTGCWLCNRLRTQQKYTDYSASAFCAMKIIILRKIIHKLYLNPNRIGVTYSLIAFEGEGGVLSHVLLYLLVKLYYFILDGCFRYLSWLRQDQTVIFLAVLFCLKHRHLQWNCLVWLNSAPPPPNAIRVKRNNLHIVL